MSKMNLYLKNFKLNKKPLYIDTI